MKFPECTWNLLQVNHVTYCPRWFSFDFFLSWAQQNLNSRPMKDLWIEIRVFSTANRNNSSWHSAQFPFSPPNRSNLYYFENIWSAYAINSWTDCFHSNSNFQSKYFDWKLLFVNAIGWKLINRAPMFCFEAFIGAWKRNRNRRASACKSITQSIALPRSQHHVWSMFPTLLIVT